MQLKSISMASQAPVIPSLDLEQASAAVVDKKKSFGKIKSSFKVGFARMLIITSPT
jgi:hypothetical protein